MRNRKKSLQLKLLSLSALLIGLIAVSGGVSLMALGAVKDKGATMYSDRVVPLTQIGEVRGLLGDIDSQIQRAITSGKPTVEFSDITTADTEKISEIVTAVQVDRPRPRPRSGTWRRGQGVERVHQVVRVAARRRLAR
jgi:beta-phosphoglucomutase-like phosphatase (HAD superfamily)